MSTTVDSDPEATKSCIYCTKQIDAAGDTYLQCVECHGDVHIKCLRMAGTPGDLLGDIFYDLTCANCMQLQHDEPTTSSAKAPEIREQFKRQHLPWLMIITLALYNLSVKSKGLSRDGYFHWRTHITSFITKHWEYLFESSRRKRKKWIGSVSGALSHNNPAFFLSGQEKFNESGWWKLRHANLTPKYIYKLYEQQSQNRSQQRTDKRQLEESEPVDVVENKRMRRTESDEDTSMPTDSCSRTIPYMGRKPKMPKQLEVPPEEPVDLPPLNTVQSSLMDFLAENLSNDHFSMFNHLPSIAAEPLEPHGPADAHLSALGSDDNANFFDGVHSFHANDTNFELPSTSAAAAAAVADQNLRNFYEHQEQLDRQQYLSSPSLGAALTTSEYSNDADGDNNNDNDYDDDDDDDVADSDEFQPRIVQVTNFQQMENADEPFNDPHPKRIKEEPSSDTEPLETSLAKSVRQQRESLDGSVDDDDQAAIEALPQCKPSLFTKTTRRNWPWLVQKTDDYEDELNGLTEEDSLAENARLTMMSEYEERELLYKIRRIFALETKCQLQIPAYIRRFYRKLCIREWKRHHSKPLFNLDAHLDERTKLLSSRDSKSEIQIIDRYQLISSTTGDAKKSFYARIAGSFHYELFESPYTHRILHPFIYRNTKCCPPWLKLMCELKYAKSGVPPPRSSIDYCYVRPNHIAAVNALLQSSFWPGIDMSECLSCPDFSVVALYKKLVIGCAFLVPDVGYNEAYISFMAVRHNWQRSGIATFMLYHLIQTCMSKDITLHVSASNPAVVLYQKFGFKIEEVILNFYDKYLPLDSKQSRTAFFLRLMR